MLEHVSVEDISKAQLSKQINHQDMIETVERLLMTFRISQERVPPPAATYSRLQQPTDAYRQRLAGLVGKPKTGQCKSLRIS